jgi:hypothetical protein
MLRSRWSACSQCPSSKVVREPKEQEAGAKTGDSEEEAAVAVQSGFRGWSASKAMSGSRQSAAHAARKVTGLCNIM